MLPGLQTWTWVVGPAAALQLRKRRSWPNGVIMIVPRKGYKVMGDCCRPTLIGLSSLNPKS